MFCCFGKKLKNHHCKIVLLDETDFIQEFQDTSKGQQLLDVVFKHLNLMETAYFGLRYLDSTGQRHWLDASKNIIKQLKGLETFTFYFGVKFYASDPCKLLEEITRYQFFLQVKQDIYQGRLPLTFDLAAELFAYAIQSELGDHDPRRHQPGYPAEFRFAANQTPEIESKAAEIHKSLGGRVPAIAEMSFLDRVKWLDMFGVDLHPVLGEDNIEYFLGLTPSGILVLRNKSKVGNYFWPRISKVFYKRKYFMIRVRDKNNDENTYGFELPNKQACKHLWKCCVDHRTFFKLTQVREIPGQSNKVIGLENKFMYSGGPDKNIQMCGLQARLRTPPTFTRVPSRRYQKRLGQPDGADAGTQAEDKTRPDVKIPDALSNTPQPILIPSLHRSTSVPSVAPYNSPYRAAPWEDPRLSAKGLYSSGANPSPRSVRSAGALPSRRYPLQHRSGSVDSTASCDYRKRKHHHNRRQSDNESEVSKSSRCSKNSRSSRHRRHGSQSGDGSDSETQQRHRRHSRRKKHAYELVDSEGQWRELQRQTEQPQARTHSAVVRDLSKRKSGYMNSGLETESETNYSHRRRHRRHRSRSTSPDGKNAIPHEVKKYIEYNLVDPSALTEDERRNIKYTKVQADSRYFKIRYSPSSSRNNMHTSQLSVRNPSTGILQPSSNVQPPEDPGRTFMSAGMNDYPPIHADVNGEGHRPLIPKVTLSNGIIHSGYNLNRDGGNSNYSSNKMQSQIPNLNMLTDWNQQSNRPTNVPDNHPDLKNDQMMNGNTNHLYHQDSNHFSPQDRISGKIRMVNGHFYPAPQKPPGALPPVAPRVTFQSDTMTQQFPKTASSSRSWVQPSTRPQSEVQKPPENSNQNHEMSTEL